MSSLDPVTGRPYAAVGRRLAAYLLDSAAVSLLFVLGMVLFLVGVGNESLVLIALALVLLLGAAGYGLLVLVGIATRGQSPGKKALGLVVLHQDTGRPIGFVPALLRQLVVGVLSVVNLVQLFLIGKHPRRQGWHDLVGRSVVLDERTAPAPAAASAGPSAAAATPSLATGALPPPPGAVIHPPAPAPSGGMIAPPPTVVPPPPPPPAPQPDPIPDQTRLSPLAPAPEPEGFPDATRVSPRSPAAAPQPVRPRWLLAGATAPERELSHLLLAGRDPDVSLVGGSVAWRLQDPELTVSKTHALFGLDDGAPWVEDWHSTNGVVLRRDGAETELPPHERTVLRGGDEVLLGDFAIQVRRA